MRYWKLPILGSRTTANLSEQQLDVALEAQVGEPSEQPKVDNPYRTQLEALKRNLVDEVKELKKCLKTASQDVGDKKKSWVGKTANKWHDEIEGNRGRMIREIDKLIPAVQKRIDALPEKVSPSEAKMMRMDLR
ncbi:hypothetical protein [Streptomyces sp. NBC_00878]|uniref:hypothetical protein n=1 Tax=Streptomyces sp. NBC_00878 TaxID=2975854 RepID=UPI00224CC1B2|nr:hypothetical protein [Streptomyces sp. NBC_00878]MCX4907946.1 hypothetical protein [Streptomyces sp. NBC_00878]